MNKKDDDENPIWEDFEIQMGTSNRVMFIDHKEPPQ